VRRPYALERILQGRRVVPNEVYKAAVQGLGALVAPKVAKRIVDDALRASSRTSEDVSESAMRNLLLTRIKRELEEIFPANIVAPGLRRIAADVANVRTGGQAANSRRGLFGSRRGKGGGRTDERRANRAAKGRRRDDDTSVTSPEAAADLLDIDGPESREGPAPGEGLAPREGRHDEKTEEERLDRSVKQSSVYLPAVDLPEAMPATVTGTGGRQVLRSTGLVVPPAMVDHVIRTFAELETVRQIVVIDGLEVTQVRGEGLATDRLAALSVATKGLLARAGDLRVFSLEFDDGVLFLFPTRDGAIVVLTQPKVNIGAVLAARADLEEAA